MFVNHVKENRTIFGLTGGIASGKSEAIKQFQKQGFFIIDSDKIVYDLWENKSVLKQIKEALNIDIEIDKKMVSKLIFNSKEKRDKLNQVLHPLVYQEIENQLKNNKNELRIIIDMPLLYEVGYENKCDYVIVVYVNEENQINRLIKRDGLTKKDAVKRINSQMSLEEKAQKADFVIDNNDTIDKMNLQIDHLVRSFYHEY